MWWDLGISLSLNTSLLIPCERCPDYQSLAIPCFPIITTTSPPNSQSPPNSFSPDLTGTLCTPSILPSHPPVPFSQSPSKSFYPAAVRTPLCRKTSLRMENSKIIRRQKLDELENKWKNLEGIGEKQEQTVKRLETTAMLLVGSYIYLQSLIFRSVSRMSCEFWWAPFSLSCLICVVFAIPFKSFVTKWERTQRYYEINFLKQDSVHLQIVISSSSDHDKQLEQQQPQPAKILRSDDWKMYQRRAFICLVSLALGAYTVVVLMACRFIPCQRAAIL